MALEAKNIDIIRNIHRTHIESASWSRVYERSIELEVEDEDAEREKIESQSNKQTENRNTENKQNQGIKMNLKDQQHGMMRLGKTPSSHVSNTTKEPYNLTPPQMN